MQPADQPRRQRPGWRGRCFGWGRGAYFPCLLPVELAVVGAEAWVYRLLLGLPWNRALGWSAGLNAFSCLAGLVFF